MRRGSIVVILFVLIVAGIIGASQFIKSQPPLEFIVAVDPLASKWVGDAVTALNATNPNVNQTRRVLFRVTDMEDNTVWSGKSGWTNERHPVAWIPSSSASIGYAAESGLPVVSAADSLARTPLVWGGYASRVNLLTDGGKTPLDWKAVEKAAQAESWSKLGGQSDWGFVKLAFPQPTSKMSGLAVLLSGAASFSKTDQPGGAVLGATSFRDWLKPIVASVPNFNTLGGDPAATMASRGPSTVEIALFPEAQWLNNVRGMSGNEDVRLSYPAYQFQLDFPLARWTDPTVSGEEQAAVDLLKGWLMNTAQQDALPKYGLRPANGEPPATADLFANAQQYGVQLTPSYGQAIKAPSRSEAQGIIQWFAANQ
jgi:hypothetical protein